MKWSLCSQNNLSLSLSGGQERGMIGRYGLKSSRKARSFRSQHVVYSKAYTDAKTITFPFPPLTCVHSRVSMFRMETSPLKELVAMRLTSYLLVLEKSRCWWKQGRMKGEIGEEGRKEEWKKRKGRKAIRRYGWGKVLWNILRWFIGDVNPWLEAVLSKMEEEECTGKRKDDVEVGASGTGRKSFVGTPSWFFAPS